MLGDKRRGEREREKGIERERERKEERKRGYERLLRQPSFHFILSHFHSSSHFIIALSLAQFLSDCDDEYILRWRKTMYRVVSEKRMREERESERREWKGKKTTSYNFLSIWKNGRNQSLSPTLCNSFLVTSHSSPLCRRELALLADKIQPEDIK